MRRTMWILALLSLIVLSCPESKACWCRHARRRAHENCGTTVAYVSYPTGTWTYVQAEEAPGPIASGQIASPQTPSTPEETVSPTPSTSSPRPVTPPPSGPSTSSPRPMKAEEQQLLVDLNQSLNNINLPIKSVIVENGKVRLVGDAPTKEDRDSLQDKVKSIMERLRQNNRWSGFVPANKDDVDISGVTLAGQSVQP